MKKLRDAAYILALAIFFLLAVLFSLPEVSLLGDGTAGELLASVLSRAALTAFLILLFAFRGQMGALRFAHGKGAFLFCLLPLCVAVVNFPFSALASGTAWVDRPDMVPLFLVECLLIGTTEELLFRAVVHASLREALEEKRHGVLLATVLSSAVFALWHLVNLFYGAGVGPTLLQVGYTFLLGCMFAAMYDRTGNIWLCVSVHALFDVGGTMIGRIGSGDPHDLIFWILTAVFGVLCAIQIVISVFRADRRNKENA